MIGSCRARSPPTTEARDVSHRPRNRTRPQRTGSPEPSTTCEAEANSDVDLLVEMEPGRNLLDLVVFWQDVEDLLGTHVDVLTDGGVSPYMRERIFAEAVSL